MYSDALVVTTVVLAIVAGPGIAGKNFLGMCKFLQFLGLLAMVNGLPEALSDFFQKFAAVVAIDFVAILDYLPLSMQEKIRGDPNRDPGLKRGTEEAAASVGFPPEAALALMQTTVGGQEISAAERKRRAGGVMRKYKDQFIAFQENLAAFEKDFVGQKVVLFV